MEEQAIIEIDAYHELKNQVGADFVIELVDTYFQETAGLIEQLRQALAARDAAAFGRLAHSIKSSSASLGAQAFAQQARELELIGKAGDLAGAGPKVEQLAADFELVMRCLEELKNEP
jgi:HPt (histidine-containing phosphotransfer) domain-containing protein